VILLLPGVPPHLVQGDAESMLPRRLSLRPSFWRLRSSFKLPSASTVSRETIDASAWEQHEIC